MGAWPTTQACADWESNEQPFGSQAGTQSTEPHQPGLLTVILCCVSMVVVLDFTLYSFDL